MKEKLQKWLGINLLQSLMDKRFDKILFSISENDKAVRRRYDILQSKQNLLDDEMFGLREQLTLQTKAIAKLIEELSVIKANGKKTKKKV